MYTSSLILGSTLPPEAIIMAGSGPAAPPATPTPPRAFCKLPNSWLLELVCYVHSSSSKLALCRCCNTMNDLLLSVCPVKLCLHLRPQAFLSNIKALSFANLRSKQIKLDLVCLMQLSNEQAAHAIGSLLRHAAPAGLTSIKELRLDGRVVLNRLVPDYLLSQLGQLQRLSLSHVTFQSLAACSLAHVYPSLTSLHLSDICSSSLTRAAVQQQVQHLPGLSDLSISRPVCLQVDEESDPWDCWLGLPSALSSQLTSLRLQGDDLPERVTSDSATFNTLFPPGTSFPNLKHLHVDFHLFSASAVQTLLRAAPRLEHLSVIGFWLEPTADLTHVPCSWRKLHLHEVCVEHLARLPLRQVEHLVMTGSMVRVSQLGAGVEDDLQLTSSAVEQVKACGGLRRTPELAAQELQVYCGEASDPSILSQSLPLLVDLECSGLVIREARPVVVGNITGLEQHTISPNLTFLGCSWEADAWARMPHLATLLTKLTLHSCDVTLDMTEALIKQVSDQRAEHQVQQDQLFTIRLSRDEAAGIDSDWEQKLTRELATTAPGIKLSLLPDNSATS